MNKSRPLAEQFMSEALRSARRALYAGEAPIGACLVHEGAVLASGHNGVIAGPDVTAHAEIAVIRAACRQLRRTRLDHCTLYVTVEPCPMCVAACHYAGIEQIVFAVDLAALAAITGNELTTPLALPGMQLHGGVMADDARELLEQWRLRIQRPA